MTTKHDNASEFGSWIPEENRSKEAREYLNYWKEDKEIRKKLTKAGLDPNAEREELLEEIKELRNAVEREKSKTETYRKIAETNQLVFTRKDNEVQKLHAEIQETKKTALIQQALLRKAIEKLEKWGDHSEECCWVEIRSCGRIIPGGEEEHCTCGWYRETKDILKFGNGV